MYTNFNKTKSRVGLMIWAKAKDKKRQTKKKKRKDRANDQVLFYSEGSRKLSKLRIDEVIDIENYFSCNIDTSNTEILKTDRVVVKLLLVQALRD